MQLKLVDLETQMKIDTLMDYSYDKTVERMNAIEDAPHSVIYQTMIVVKNNSESFAMAYANYYSGCLEGIFFTRFLEEFNRMPTPSENSFIKNSIESRFEDFKKMITDLALRRFKEEHGG